MAFEKHKIRVAKTESFIYNNKIFIVFAIIATIILLCGVILNDKKENNAAVNNSSSIEISDVIGNAEAATEVVEAPETFDTVVAEEKVDTNINSAKSEKRTIEWRFYWIDLWIFLIAGGFCLIKILQEKKRAREKLK